MGCLLRGQATEKLHYELLASLVEEPEPVEEIRFTSTLAADAQQGLNAHAEGGGHFKQLGQRQRDQSPLVPADRFRLDPHQLGQLALCHVALLPRLSDSLTDGTKQLRVCSRWS